MSIKVITTVWDKSQHKGNTLLALLALADNANDDGYCWPGLDNIAQKTRVSRNTVIRCIRALEETAELFCDHNRRHGNRYLITVNRKDAHIRMAMEKYFKMDEVSINKAIDEINNLRVKCQNDTYQNDTSEVNPSSLQKSHNYDTSEVNPSSQEPSLNRQQEPSKEDVEAEKTPSDHQQLFGAICWALGIDPQFATDQRKETIGKAAKQILKAHGKPEQIARFMPWLTKKLDWKGDITEIDMIKHWGEFATFDAPTPPVDFGPHRPHTKADLTPEQFAQFDKFAADVHASEDKTA